MKLRANIKVNGIVQGVGFRPFIHKQITDHSLSGWIRNTSEGAEIDIEGDEARVALFEDELWSRVPKLAVIESVHVEKPLPLKNYTGFEIIKSRALNERNTLISPDVCICDDCLRELFDPSDRRYRYPFINCTNCGPRFTIIKDVPYDRPNTTMADFAMCAPCEEEYKDISDRRYHAQPVCCPDCGPRLIFCGADGSEAPGDPVFNAQQIIRDAGIVAVKGLGGIHLACRADDPDIALMLRRRKHRDEKPFALMCRDVLAARRICEISPEEESVLAGFRRPIVLLRKRPGVELDHISENGRIGVMLPYTPLHYLLMDGAFDSLIMTSANLSEQPIIYKNEEALSGLCGIADAFLLNNRDIHVRCDDSLCYVVDKKEYFVRRSRGYAPFPLRLGEDCSGILACGAEQKASFALSKGNYIFPSQHIGDLKNIESFGNYSSQIGHFKRLFDIRPELVACDLHPDYLSTQFAEGYAKDEKLPLVRIQHHFAHMASCMADNGLDGRVLGVIWDGSGYGTDGTVWGGEFLAGAYSGFERMGRLRPIRLPGGDKAAGELWRVGISLLKDSGQDASQFFEKASCERILAQLAAGINCPEASSMGRLFDGVSALLGIRKNAGYEGQGAVLLEAAAVQGRSAVYGFGLSEKDGLIEFDWRPMLADICADIRSSKAVPEIAAGFMNTCIAAASGMLKKMREDTGLGRVVLSGGSFQNMYLLEGLKRELEKSDFKVYHHSRVSPNDEGICIGQTMIARHGGGIYVPCGTS